MRVGIGMVSKGEVGLIIAELVQHQAYYLKIFILQLLSWSQ